MSITTNNIIDRGYWVYDLEQFSNLHSCYATNIDTGEDVFYIIHKDRDDRKKYLNWLETRVNAMIGFNSLRYDGQIINAILRQKREFINKDLSYIIKALKKYSDKVINTQRSKGQYLNLRDFYIPQIDLFSIQHYNNKARITSLKWLEFTLRWKDLRDLPYHHTAHIDSNMFDELYEYNKNDVDMTKFFYDYSQSEINLRKTVGDKYGIDFTNDSRSSMGVKLVSKFYSQLSGKNYYSFKKLRDTRPTCYARDIIDDRIEFESEELSLFLKALKQDTRNLLIKEKKEDKNKFEYHVKFAGVTYKYAKGGLHSEVPSQTFEETEDYQILDFDWGSYYPNLMIDMNVIPPHLGKEFLQVISDVTSDRLDAKSKYKELYKILSDKAHISSLSDDLISKYTKDYEEYKTKADALKITINSIYGNLGNEYSYMYSPTSLLKVTLNGQLFMLMLIERLTKYAKCQCFYANTDGFTCKVPIDMIDKYYEVCKEFYKLLPIAQEFVRYKACRIRDVNNYHIIPFKGKPKRKGFFELPSKREPHKNNSAGIIQIALDKYYTDNIPVEQTIKNHKDIYDFCIGARARKAAKKGDAVFELRSIQNGYYIIETLSKTVRYYVSNQGKTLVKSFEDDSSQFEHAEGWKVTIMNKYVDKSIDQYNIDYRYYIRQCNKIIYLLETPLSLF